MLPPLECVAEWWLDDLLEYMTTWSAWKRYREATDEDPIDRVRERLVAAWPAGDGSLAARWKVQPLVGRVRGTG